MWRSNENMKDFIIKKEQSLSQENKPLPDDIMRIEQDWLRMPTTEQSSVAPSACMTSSCMTGLNETSAVTPECHSDWSDGNEERGESQK